MPTLDTVLHRQWFASANDILFSARLPGTRVVQAEPTARAMACRLFPLDDHYVKQMALRRRLINEKPIAVHALSQTAQPAAAELLNWMVDKQLRHLGFTDLTKTTQTKTTKLRCPDGTVQQVDWNNPLLTLGRLIPYDFCLLHRSHSETEHRLTGAILCFPASWSLKEKFMYPLFKIHAPVINYGHKVASTVQRMFDRLPVGKILWRMNAMWYDDPSLFYPRSHALPQRIHSSSSAFLRSERQLLIRLPVSQYTAFIVQTFVIEKQHLSPSQTKALDERNALIEQQIFA